MSTNPGTNSPNQAAGYTGPSPIVYGDIKGQLAIGDNNILYQVNVNGGVANIFSGPPPKIQSLSRPVSLLPRAFPGFLDRQQEIMQVSQSVNDNQPVEINGIDGQGKSSFLRYLAYQDIIKRNPDGVIWIKTSQKPVDDLILVIYEQLFQVPETYKPSEGQILKDLQSLRAVLLLDDIELSRQEIERLINNLPQAMFILASKEGRLTDGRTIQIHGLPDNECLELITRTLGRELLNQEKQEALTLCHNLVGNPGLIQESTRLVVDGKETFGSLASKKTSGEISRKVFDTQPVLEKQLLTFLAVMGDVSLHENDLAVLTNRPDSAQVLQALEDKYLVQSHSPRYTVNSDLAGIIRQSYDITEYGNILVKYFTNKARKETDSKGFQSEVDVLIHLIDWAGKREHWNDVLRLIYASDAGIVLAKRLGAWRYILEWGLAAARALKDQKFEGWALHQLGTRALCLGDHSTAKLLLNQASNLRQRIGDRQGLEVTRHNLNLLTQPVVLKQPQPEVKPPFKFPFALVFTLFAVAIIIGLAIINVGIPALFPPNPTFTQVINPEDLTSTIIVNITKLPSHTPVPTMTATIRPSTTPAPITPSITSTGTSTSTATITVTPTPTSPVCIGFEDLPIDTKYDTDNDFAFTSEGYKFRAQRFFFTCDGPGCERAPDPGVLYILDSDWQFPGNHIIQVERANLKPRLQGETLRGLTIDFHYPNTFFFDDVHATRIVNLVVNFEVLSISDFWDLDGRIVDGVAIRVIPIPGYEEDPTYGRLVLKGALSNFEVGGYYMELDDFCPFRP
jgi:hypothetical protein